MRIGLFDSGVGGLTVLKTLKEKYPNNDYVYYGDTKNIPYGNKKIAELRKLAMANMNFLLDKNVDMIIVACGTVSSNCLDYIKENQNIPIMSVITPTIKYLNESNYNNILVIATKATINSHMFKNNINKNVYEVAIPELASLIEDDNLDNIDDLLYSYIADYIDNIDLIVLGCTHYPVIREQLAKIINKNTQILDMSTLLSIPNNGNGTTEIYFSKIDDKIIKNAKKILDNSNIEIKVSNNKFID